MILVVERVRGILTFHGPTRNVFRAPGPCLCFVFFVIGVTISKPVYSLLMCQIDDEQQGDSNMKVLSKKDMKAVSGGLTLFGTMTEFAPNCFTAGTSPEGMSFALPDSRTQP